MTTGSCGNNNLNGTVYTHDGFGRIIGSAQTANSTPTAPTPADTFSYTYNLADQLTSIQYRSGRTVNYTINGTGLVQNVKDAAVGGKTYASLAYTPFNGVATVTMPHITENWNWNDRGQVTQLQAGSQLSLNFYPCPGQVTACASQNTGSLWGGAITVPGLNQLSQSFNYDGLNRLLSAGEAGEVPGGTEPITMTPRQPGNTTRSGTGLSMREARDSH